MAGLLAAIWAAVVQPSMAWATVAACVLVPIVLFAPRRAQLAIVVAAIAANYIWAVRDAKVTELRSSLDDAIQDADAELHRLLNMTHCRYDLFGSNAAIECPSPFECVRREAGETAYRDTVLRMFDNEKISDLAWAMLARTVGQHYDCMLDWADEYARTRNKTYAHAVGARVLAVYDQLHLYEEVMDRIEAAAPGCVGSYRVLNETVLGSILEAHLSAFDLGQSPLLYRASMDNTRMILVSRIYTEGTRLCLQQSRVRRLGMQTPNWCGLVETDTFEVRRECPLESPVPPPRA